MYSLQTPAASDTIGESRDCQQKKFYCQEQMQHERHQHIVCADPRIQCCIDSCKVQDRHCSCAQMLLFAEYVVHSWMSAACNLSQVGFSIHLLGGVHVVVLTCILVLADKLFK